MIPRKYGLLIADDEEDVRDVLNVVMRRAGFSVWLAVDGHAALALYRRHRATIDVILLDVRMPGLNGPQTLAALQQLTPRIRCCFMSGDTGGYTQQNLRDLGAATVFAKPFRGAEVAQVLTDLAHGHHAAAYGPSRTANADAVENAAVARVELASPTGQRVWLPTARSPLR